MLPLQTYNLIADFILIIGILTSHYIGLIFHVTLKQKKIIFINLDECIIHSTYVSSRWYEGIINFLKTLYNNMYTLVMSAYYTLIDELCKS